jgi:6,7-dimethyl-8-ribityllumazine synthase
LKTELNRVKLSAAGCRFGIVVSRWNSELTTRLADGAVEAIYEAGADPESIEIFHVPGSFELPIACLKAAQSGEFDAVIALGVIIRGDTPHFEYVSMQTSAGIMQASMLTGVPVLFGVITANDLEQAKQRSGEKADNKGYEAAHSAVEMVNLFREMYKRNNQGRGDKVLQNVV